MTQPPAPWPPSRALIRRQRSTVLASVADLARSARPRSRRAFDPSVDLVLRSGSSISRHRALELIVIRPAAAAGSRRPRQALLSLPERSTSPALRVLEPLLECFALASTRYRPLTVVRTRARCRVTVAARVAGSRRPRRGAIGRRRSFEDALSRSVPTTAIPFESLSEV